MLFLPYREWPLALQTRPEWSFSPHVKSLVNQVKSGAKESALRKTKVTTALETARTNIGARPMMRLLNQVPSSGGSYDGPSGGKWPDPSGDNSWPPVITWPAGVCRGAPGCMRDLPYAR